MTTKNMKLLILAAGRGTRFGELTRDKPKILLPVLGKPFLYYLLREMKKINFEKILVVVGYKAKSVKDFLKSYNPEIKIINQFEVLGEEKHGTACPVLAVEKEVGRENFISLYGDGLYLAEDIREMMVEDNLNYVAGVKKEDVRKYGEIVLKNGNLVEIREKPAEKKEGLVNVGLYKFTPEIFKALENLGKSERGEYELVDAVNLLAREGGVKVKEVDEGSWIDYGSPDDLARVEEFIKTRKYGDH